MYNVIVSLCKALYYCSIKQRLAPFIFSIKEILLFPSADFGMDDREMMRDASTFEEDIMHGATASNLLLETEPGPANLPDKSNHMEYDGFGDGAMGNSDGGMLGELLDSLHCRNYTLTAVL